MNWNNDPAHCELARAAIADSLVGRDAAVDAVALEAHLASCAECRRYRDECTRLWTTLGELSVPAPAADAEERFAKRLALEPSAAAARQWRLPRSVFSTGLAAAALLVAALGGYTVGGWRANRGTSVAPVVASPDSGQEFLLLLYDVYTGAPAPSAADMPKIVAEYSAWGRGLRANGQLVIAEKLTDAPSQWYGSVPPPVDGRLGGFFLIRARDLSEAHRIAADCPHVKHGGRVELRPIQPT